jgi:hypothetical protein
MNTPLFTKETLKHNYVLPYKCNCREGMCNYVAETSFDIVVLVFYTMRNILSYEL